MNEPGTETQFYPQTHEKAVIDGNGNTLDVKIAGKQDELVSGENIKTVNGESILGSGNIVAGDPNAVKYTAQSLNDSQRTQARTNIGSGTYSKPGSGIPKTDMDSGVNASLDLADSAVQCRPSGEVDPTITPADYATTEELDQLEAIMHNLSGKFYEPVTSSDNLPEGDEVGYTFVGATTPFAIWYFDGEDWSDTGMVVTAITGKPGADGIGLSSATSEQDGTVVITMTNGDTIVIDMNHSHPEYFSKILGGAQPSGGFLPDVVYSLGTLTGTITFSLAAAVTGNVNHYFWMFDTSSTAPTITWPTGITWAAGAAPTVAASKHYEISILGGIAYYSEV